MSKLSAGEEFLDEETKKMVIWGDCVDGYTYLTIQEESANYYLQKARRSDGAAAENCIYYVAEVQVEYRIVKRNGMKL